jgi:SPP1 gp7 family putative phage head morphogenesis protein
VSSQPTQTPGRIYEVAAQFQRELGLSQQAAEDQMLASWRNAYGKIRDEYQQVLDKIADAVEAGEEISPAWLYQQTRLEAAEREARAQMARYAQEAENATQAAQEAAVRASQRHHGALVEQAAAQANLTASFVDPNPDNLRHLTGHLADGSPLAGLFSGLGEEVAQQARDALVQGVTLGWNPNRMATQIGQALDMPRHRAITIMRTESQRVYRETARETYMANDDVVASWTWMATLSPRTCPACLAMHGTVHPVTETLDGHPRCRCAMIPQTPSWADLGVEGVEDTRPPVPDAREWLEGQPPSVQRAILGQGKWKAWKAGDITLDDMVARTHSADWGTMRRERSLVEIAQGRNANTLPTVTPKAPQQPTTGLRYDGRAEWDRWHDGRDHRIGTVDDTAALWADKSVERAQGRVGDDLEQVRQAKARLKEEQDRLRSYVPDAKERAKAARTDTGILRTREALKASEEYLAASQKALDEAVAYRSRFITSAELPDFDADNPLKGYGDRLVISDTHQHTHDHLHDLETHVPLHHHQAVRNHYAAVDGGGLHVGDELLPDLDDLARLRGSQPRGHAEGASWDGVGGVYDPNARVTAVARRGWRRDTDTDLHATAVHEMGHTVEDAYQGLTGERASASAEWADAMRPLHDFSDLKPYYHPAANPTGHASESWAEAYAGWAMARALPMAQREVAILRSMTIRSRTTEARQAARAVVAYFDKVDKMLAQRVR